MQQVEKRANSEQVTTQGMRKMGNLILVDLRKGTVWEELQTGRRERCCSAWNPTGVRFGYNLVLLQRATCPHASPSPFSVSRERDAGSARAAVANLAPVNCACGQGGGLTEHFWKTRFISRRWKPDSYTKNSKASPCVLCQVS